MADNEKKRRSRYTVLLVPGSAQRVRQFHVSIDLVILISILLSVFLFAGVSYVTYSASRIEQMREEVGLYKGQAEAVLNENIILQADVEELSAELRNAKVTINARNTAMEKEEKEASMQYIPSGLPIDGTVSLPAAYTNENPYVVFQAGYGSRAVASADGVVSHVGDDAEYGHIVKVDHGNGYVSVYRNASDPVVDKGDRVIRGMTLYVMRENTESLTYQITFEGDLIDPMTILEING